MDWLFAGCIIVLFLLVTCIIFLLFSISKREDERGAYIKKKAMANTFGITIGILVLNVIEKIVFVLQNESSVYKERTSIILLITLSIVYLVTLLWERRKCGG